jgi:hypothetical protein
MLALAQPCPTCEALARAVMMDQTSHDAQRKPLTESMIKAGLDELDAIRQTELVGDYELIKRLLEAALAQPVQPKRIEELEAMLERQTARIVDLQEHIENFEGEDR